MEVRDVLVTGGTGRLGKRVVDRLRAEGIEPRVMSRSGRPGTIKGDLLTGEGIEAAVREPQNQRPAPEPVQTLRARREHAPV